MSPTSYQAAPPRFMTIADAPRTVKFRLLARMSHPRLSIRSLRAVRPANDFLLGGLPPGTGREAHERGVSADRAGNIDRPRSGERRVGHRVRNGHGERRAIVSHVHLENVAAVQTYPATQRDRWTGGRRAIGVQASGVIAFVRILEQIEFHRHAGGDAWRPAR